MTLLVDEFRAPNGQKKPATPIDPDHYRAWKDRVGVEPKDIAAWLPYHVGTALVYLMRAGRKVDGGETPDEAEARDCRKAIEHIRFHLEHIERRIGRR